MIDDSGHFWNLKLEFVDNYKYVKFGGDWKLFRNARKLYEGQGIRLGYVLWVTME